MTQETKSLGFYHKETGDAFHLECSKKWSLNPRSTRIEIRTREEAGDRKCIECGKPIAPEKPEAKMSSRIIATGGSSKTADDAIEFLKERGAKVDSALGITVIQLPESAELEGRGWEHTISFYDSEGNYEDKYVVVELDIDVSWTILHLRNDRNG